MSLMVWHRLTRSIIVGSQQCNDTSFSYFDPLSYVSPHQFCMTIKLFEASCVLQLVVSSSSSRAKSSQRNMQEHMLLSFFQKSHKCVIIPWLNFLQIQHTSTEALCAPCNSIGCCALYARLSIGRESVVNCTRACLSMHCDKLLRSI